MAAHYLDTTRILTDEATGIISQRRIVIPYSDLCGPFEDVTEEYGQFEYVTAVQDINGEVLHLLEPLQKVLDGWLLYMESNENPFSFSLS